jgi:hypothetical protein
LIDTGLVNTFRHISIYDVQDYVLGIKDGAVLESFRREGFSEERFSSIIKRAKSSESEEQSTGVHWTS